MSDALGGDIPFLPARTDFNLLDAIFIQPGPATADQMVPVSVNFATDSPEILGWQVESLTKELKRVSIPGNIVLMNGEAAKRAITASVESASVAAASLSNLQQSAIGLELALTNIETKSLIHGNHLQDFLTRNIMSFLEKNMGAVGCRILGEQLRGRPRLMALGFVVKCTKAEVYVKQRVEKTSSNQAHGYTLAHPLQLCYIRNASCCCGLWACCVVGSPFLLSEIGERSRSAGREMIKCTPSVP
jgi:hypothetical protein